jgi:hypothetical protein
LNGGTSKTMMEHVQTLLEFDVKFTTFCEPDLYGNMTAICFLADERIWDKEKYPGRWEWVAEMNKENPLHLVHHIFDEEKFIKTIGGENNFKIREFISKFRLA